MLIPWYIDLPLLLGLCLGGRRLRIAAGAVLLAERSAFALVLHLPRRTHEFPFSTYGSLTLVSILVWAMILYLTVPPRPWASSVAPASDVPPELVSGTARGLLQRLERGVGKWRRRWRP